MINLLKPYIQWDHIDGPLLHCSDGSIHFLSLLERMYMRIGIMTVHDLDFKYRTDIPNKP